jgi:hypothetical protein
LWVSKTSTVRSRSVFGFFPGWILTRECNRGAQPVSTETSTSISFDCSLRMKNLNEKCNLPELTNSPWSEPRHLEPRSGSERPTPSAPSLAALQGIARFLGAIATPVLSPRLLGAVGATGAPLPGSTCRLPDPGGVYVIPGQVAEKGRGG